MKTDVLILGGGLSALTAAYTCLQTDPTADVTLLQCGAGASPYIHGFCLPVGEGDSSRCLLEDTLASGCGCTDPVLAERLAQDSLLLPDWLEELQLQIDADENGPRLLKSLGSSVARIAGIQNAAGPSIMARLRQRLGQLPNYRELGGQRAMELLTQQDAVVGARCFDISRKEFYNCYARCVILATGGFCRIFPSSTNSAEMGGDGIAMAQQAGAKLRDMEFIQFEPCVATWPEAVAGKGIITTMFYEGAVLRKENGERFMDECVPKDVLAKGIAAQKGTVYLDATAVAEQLWQTVYKPYLQRYLACGVDLRTTAVPVAPAAHTSCGGVVIDEACRTGVPGLLACGEVTGGLHGANRLGGNAGLETLVFGRIAGRTAAAERLQISLPEDEMRREDTPADVSPLRQELKTAVAEGLGVVRTHSAMEKALLQVQALLVRLGDAEGCYEKMRLRNDLLTVKWTLESALARKQSLGCHEVHTNE